MDVSPKKEVEMSNSQNNLWTVYDGWNGYHRSIVNAVQPLNREQLIWRPADGFNSVGELVRHIGLGRLTWLLRMGAPGSIEAVSQIGEWETDADGNHDIVEGSLNITEQPAELVYWLETTWQIIDKMLGSWSVTDLSQAYNHTWNGDTYLVSRQWTIWRLINHDIHHGGELSLMLGLQGIQVFELSVLFGHIILPPLLAE